MNIADWILQCLNIDGHGEYLDSIDENFQIYYDPSVDETLELIRCCMLYNDIRYPLLGDAIAEDMFLHVIEKATNELGTNEQDFSYYCNGSLDTHLSYKGQTVSCWEDLEKLADTNN